MSSVNEDDAEMAPPKNVPNGASGGCGCGGTSATHGAPPTHIYAMGKIQIRFPSLSVEKEFTQVVGRANTAGLTDPQAAHAVLSKRENRYLARKVCWVLTIEGLETYLLVPRDPADVDLLLESLRQRPRHTDVDVVVGVLGPIAPPTMCNGLQVPIVGFDHIYSFDGDVLVKAIPRPEAIAEDQFAAAAETLFYRIMQMADNAGATDEQRALNYLAVRYPAIYTEAANAYGRGESLSNVEVRASRLSGLRKVVDVIFSFVNRTTDVVDKSFVRVDVTEEFPFLVTKMSAYFDR